MTVCSEPTDSTSWASAASDPASSPRRAQAYAPTPCTWTVTGDTPRPSASDLGQAARFASAWAVASLPAATAPTPGGRERRREPCTSPRLANSAATNSSRASASGSERVVAAATSRLAAPHHGLSTGPASRTRPASPPPLARRRRHAPWTRAARATSRLAPRRTGVRSGRAVRWSSQRCVFYEAPSSTPSPNRTPVRAQACSHALSGNVPSQRSRVCEPRRTGRSRPGVTAMISTARSRSLAPRAWCTAASASS